MSTAADVVICWSFAPVPKAQQAMFQRPTRFVVLPTPDGQHYATQVQAFGANPVRGILQKYAPGVTPLRIATLGFSESCQGPRALLASGDGGRIDTAIAIDGIHAQYVDQQKGIVAGAQLAPWGAFAKAAAQDNRRLCCITTSSIEPPTFASTTATANWIWRYATGTDDVIRTEELPPGIWLQAIDPPYVVAAGAVKDKTTGKIAFQWPRTEYTVAPTRRYRRANGLLILNYRNNDPSGIGDHRLQAAIILPTMVQTFLASRWNLNEPSAGTCFTVAGVGDTASCVPNEHATVVDPTYMQDPTPKPLEIPSIGPTPLPGAPSDTAAPPAGTPPTIPTTQPPPIVVIDRPPTTTTTTPAGGAAPSSSKSSLTLGKVLFVGGTLVSVVAGAVEVVKLLREGQRQARHARG